LLDNSIFFTYLEKYENTTSVPTEEWQAGGEE
jgi:hypothetical protein